MSIEKSSGLICANCRHQAIGYLRKVLIPLSGRYTCGECGTRLKVSMNNLIILTVVGIALANVLSTFAIFDKYTGLLFALVIIAIIYTAFLPLQISEDDSEDGISRGL